MKKRKIQILGLSILLFIGVTSCDEWLTITPESQIVLEEYWKSATDVQSVLNAAYRGLTEDDNIYRMIVWGELRSDNMVTGSTFASDRQDMQKILEGNITAGNKYCNWGSFYTVINYCNTLLLYAPKVKEIDFNFTQSDLNRVRAEALTLRALSYFYLVRAFKEVPWIEDASIDNTQNYSKPKDTEQTVINHIIADLDTAKLYAQLDFGRIDYNKGRITLSAVNALLADVYLWNEQYDKCVQTCDLILADKKLKLVEPPFNASYYIFYQGNSTESIFELQFKENVQYNNPVARLYGSVGNIGELAFPIPLMYNQYTAATGVSSPFNYKISSTVIESSNDIRSKDSYILNSNVATNFIFKYAGMLRTETLSGGAISPQYIIRSNTANWIVYRLTDVMLMKAEALVQLDEMNDALSLVNRTYLRSNSGQDSLKINNYPNKPALEKLVLRERQRELLFEGKRWFDLVRMARRQTNTLDLNDYVNRKAAGNAATLGAPELDAMYMPIATSELEANPNFVQNPYYRESTSITK